MEDMHHAVMLNKDARDMLFGVYDGHGGQDAVKYVHSNMPRDVGMAVHVYCLSPAAGLMRAFQDIERELMEDDDDSGCAAVLAYVKKNDQGDHDVYFAWAGDSRAVHLDSQGNIKYATTDHKPINPDERRRIENAGGTIELRRACWRINGLALSRALGDCAAKRATPGAIIAMPEIVKGKLDVGDTIVLASDGFWDKVSNDMLAFALKRQDVCKTENELDGFGNDAHLARVAVSLRDMAFDSGSRDNISVMVIGLAGTVQDRSEITQQEREKIIVDLKAALAAINGNIDEVLKKECPNDLRCDLAAGVKMRLSRFEMAGGVDAIDGTCTNIVEQWKTLARLSHQLESNNARCRALSVLPIVSEQYVSDFKQKHLQAKKILMYGIADQVDNNAPARPQDETLGEFLKKLEEEMLADKNSDVQ